MTTTDAIPVASATPGRLRILAVAPIHLPDAELARRQARFTELAGDSMTIDLVNLPTDAPRGLETADDVERSIKAVHAVAVAADPAHVDVVLPDCVLDPGVGHAETQVPMVGILATVLGRRDVVSAQFSAVTRNRAIADEFARKVAEYGLAKEFMGVDVIDMTVDEIADEAKWMTRLRATALTRSEDGAGIIINGCSAVAVEDQVMHGMVVIDPTLVALETLRSAHESSLTGSGSTPESNVATFG